MPVTWQRLAQKSRCCGKSWSRRRKPRAAEIELSHAPYGKEQEMYRFVNFGRIAAGMMLAAAAAFAPGTVSAQHLGNDVVALFPKNVGEFAYANLKQARSQKWFPQLQQQLLPERFRQFEKFLASASVDPNTQVQELVWGLVAEGVTDKTSCVGSDAVPTGEEVAGIAFCFNDTAST